MLIVLFFVSRSSLKNASQKVAHYERLQEMYKTVYELEQEGLKDDEIIDKLQMKYRLNNNEAKYLLDKSRK